MSQQSKSPAFVLTYQGVDGCTAQYDVELPEEHVRQEIEKGFRIYRRRVRLPGFRPGKAPLELVRRRFATEVLESVRQYLLREAVLAAVRDARKNREELRNKKFLSGNILNPDDIVVTENAPFACSITLEFEPDFDLPDYRNLQLAEEKPEEVSDEELEEAMEEVRERLARYEESDEPADMEDFVQVDGDGRILGEAGETGEEGEDVQRYLKLRDVWLPMIQQSNLPGAASQLVGARPGDQRKVMVDFPEDYQIASLAGKAVEYTMTVKSVQKRVKAELTDELVKERVGVESVAQLQEQQRMLLAIRKRMNWMRKNVQAIEEALLAGADFPLPPSQVEEETRRRLREVIREQMESGVPEEQVRSRAQELSEEAERRARRTLRLQYITKRIAEKEGITVPQERIDAQVAQYAQSHGLGVREVEKRMEESGGYDALRDALLVTEVINHIIEKLLEKNAENDEGAGTAEAGGSGSEDAPVSPEESAETAAAAGEAAGVGGAESAEDADESAAPGVDDAQNSGKTE